MHRKCKFIPVISISVVHEQMTVRARVGEIGPDKLVYTARTVSRPGMRSPLVSL